MFVAVMGVGATMVGWFGVQLRRMGRVNLTRPTMHVLGVAARDAQHRGHTTLTVPHVVLAMLSDPDIAHELEQRGVVLHDIYDDIERLLPPRTNETTTPMQQDAHFVAMLKASAPAALPARSTNLMTCALSAHVELRAIFAKHGVGAVDWGTRTVNVVQPSTTPIDRAPNRPYRVREKATVDVVLWNDSKTSMDFVIALLRDTFGIVEPYATRIMLATDRDGAAIVGTYDRHEADRLAQTAITLARKRGYPLRVTIEESNAQMRSAWRRLRAAIKSRFVK